MKIVVVGTGYVGLVTGAGFSENGHTVICADTDQAKIAGLQRGEIPIYEPGLDELVHRNSKAGRLSFTTDTAKAVPGADIVFFAVGTPRAHDGSADTQYLFAAAEQVAKALTGPAVLITKSTVPVGTARKVWNLVQQHTAHNFEVVSNPEFLKEGDAINDFMKPDRVVVGCQSERARAVMRELYEPLVRTVNPILFMDLESAELTKYASNAFLATRISFMNELAHLATATGADIETVRKGMGFDRRIGHLFLFPGVGYGGSCFPKDVKALVALAKEKEIPMRILDSVEEANEVQKKHFVDLLKRRFGDSLKDKTITLWGLAFKPKTDDIREAPALTIIDALLKIGAKVRAADPVAIDHTKEIYGDRVQFSTDNYSVLEGSDALLLVTEWPEFRRPDFVRIKSLMRTPIIYDGRNQYDPETLTRLGFEYAGIGRRSR